VSHAADRLAILELEVSRGALQEILRHLVLGLAAQSLYARRRSAVAWAGGRYAAAQESAARHAVLSWDAWVAARGLVTLGGDAVRTAIDSTMAREVVLLDVPVGEVISR
jgi:hypothetical protein